MLELISDAAALAVMLVVTGFMTPKFLLYGSITTGILALGYHLIGRDASTVVNSVGPDLVGILTIYPQLIIRVSEPMRANYGLLGLVLLALMAVAYFFPYIVGIWFGLTRYPELLLIRVIL